MRPSEKYPSWRIPNVPLRRKEPFSLIRLLSRIRIESFYPIASETKYHHVSRSAWKGCGKESHASRHCGSFHRAAIIIIKRGIEKSRVGSKQRDPQKISPALRELWGREGRGGREDSDEIRKKSFPNFFSRGKFDGEIKRSWNAWICDIKKVGRNIELQKLPQGD